MNGTWLNAEIGELSLLLCFFLCSIRGMKYTIQISQLENWDAEIVLEVTWYKSLMAWTSYRNGCWFGRQLCKYLKIHVFNCFTLLTLASGELWVCAACKRKLNNHFKIKGTVSSMVSPELWPYDDLSCFIFSVKKIKYLNIFCYLKTKKL